MFDAVRYHDHVLTTALRSLVDDPSAMLPSTVAEVVELRALLDRLEARWLRAVGELERSGNVKDDTGLPLTDLLARDTRRTRRDARAAVILAQKLASSSVIGPALDRGDLSLPQAATMLRVRTKRTSELFDAHEAVLVQASADLSADQLETLVFEWYRRADAATAHADAKEAAQRRELHLAPVGDMEWFLRGSLTVEQGELVHTALEAISQFEWEGSDETRTLAQRRADALASLSRYWLNQQSGTIHGQRPHVHVHVEAADLIDALRSDADDERDERHEYDDVDDVPVDDLDEHIEHIEHIEHGEHIDGAHDGCDHESTNDANAVTGLAAAMARAHGPKRRTSNPHHLGRVTNPMPTRDASAPSDPWPTISARTASGLMLDPITLERVLCDCVLQRVLTASSVVLDVGRATRTVPAPLRAAVIERDRHCRYPGCSRPVAWCDVHHLAFQRDDGPHALWNCALLCSVHHDRVHRLRERLLLHPDGRLTVTRPDGSTETSHPPGSVRRLTAKQQQRECDRADREYGSLVQALRRVADAGNWTAKDHEMTEQARARLRAAQQRRLQPAG